jgi:hypothetical protein
MRIPDEMCGALAELLRRAIVAQLLDERARLARRGEKGWRAAPWLALCEQLEQAAASANGSEPVTPAWLTVNDAAHAAGVSSRTIRSWCRTGRINAVLHAGRWLIFDLDGSVSRDRRR